jgi:hypothetical protein
MKIGHDQISEIKYDVSIKRKTMILKKAANFCNQFIQVESIDEFKTDFKKYVIKQVEQKTGIKNIDPEKLVALTDIPIHELNKLQKEYKSILVDLDKPKPDFGIYIDTQHQLQIFNELNVLCDQLNKWNPTNWMWLERSFNGKISFRGGSWIPSVTYIKSL